MTIFISCGEVSGDRYGASIAQELWNLKKELTIAANGGDALQGVGVKLLHHVTQRSSIGFVEPLKNIGYFLKVLKQTKTYIKDNNVQLVIIIDHQGFNMPLAKWCKKQGIRVVSVVAPQFWIWGQRKKAKAFVSHCDLIACIFKEEYAFYQALDAKKSIFIGHPLVQELSQRPALGALKNVIGVFPGSRPQEIAHVFPIMCKAIHICQREYPELQFKLALSSKNMRDRIQKVIDKTGVTIDIVDTDSRTLMAQVDGSIVASGTITLEHALIGTPCICCYKFSWLSYCLLRLFMQKKIDTICHGFIALPNIILKKCVMPELFQAKLTPEAIVDEIKNVVLNTSRQAFFESEFNTLRKQISNKNGGFKELVEKIVKRFDLKQ
jgi:lipid-A-disaccharide synthase